MMENNQGLPSFGRQAFFSLSGSQLRIAALAVLLGLGIAVTPTAARSLDANTLDLLAEDALRAWDVPGVAVVVVTPRQVLWLKGYGCRNVAQQSPVTPDTVFPLASCSKAFTTALAAMLVDEGKLNWDDPVRKHLPDFHLGDPLADGDVRLRDLFCHRTGLANNDFLWYRAPWPPAEVVRRTCRMPLERPFRTAFQYQSAMYTAAGFAVARAGGESWESLVRRRVFDPLGMSSSFCVTPTDEQAPDKATPYRTSRDGKLRPIPWYVQTDPNAAGSIHVSARDMAAWLRFQLSDGSFAGRRLVSAAALAETHRPQTVIPMDEAVRAANSDTVQLSYGLAWVIQDYRGHELISHGGVIDGFRAHITLMPRDGYGLALLSNRHQTRLNLALSNAIVDRLLGLSPRDWNDFFRRLEARSEEVKREARAKRDARRRPGRSSRPLADFAGDYEHPAYGRATVSVSGDRLEWMWSTFRGELARHHADVFELENELLEDPLIEFQVDQQGKVKRFLFLNLQFQRR
jgi:CubicO group peptidase (beta-lactamase class C family)